MRCAWLVAGCLFFLVGCGDDNGSLDEHRAIWEAKRPSEYVIRVCGTGFSRGCWVNAVAQQEVVAASSRVGNGGWVENDSSENEDPVAGLFRRARARDDCDRTRLSFDEQLGFVRELYFDCGEEGSGEQVTCFVPDSVDITVCQND